MAIYCFPIPSQYPEQYAYLMRLLPRAPLCGLRRVGGVAERESKNANELQIKWFDLVSLLARCPPQEEWSAINQEIIINIIPPTYL